MSDQQKPASVYIEPDGIYRDWETDRPVGQDYLGEYVSCRQGKDAGRGVLMRVSVKAYDRGTGLRAQEVLKAVTWQV